MKYCKKCGIQLVKVNLLNKLAPTIIGGAVGGAVGGALLAIIQFKAMSDWAYWMKPQALIVQQALLECLMGALIGAGIAISKVIKASPIGKVALAALGGLVYGLIAGSLIGAGIGGGIVVGEVIRKNPIVKIPLAFLGGMIGAIIVFCRGESGWLWWMIMLGGLPGAGIGIGEIISKK